MLPNTSAPVQLTQGGQSKFSPVTTPDGKKVVFADGTEQLPLSRDVFIMDADGKNLKQITHSPRLSWMPAVSPDGQQIVYTQEQDGKADLHLVSLDGSNDRNLTTDNLGYWEAQWAPDGKSILCTSTAAQDGSLHLYRVAADGSSKQELTLPGTGDCRSPHYTPDGSRIVFISNQMGQDEIYSMKPDGTDMNRAAPNLVVLDGPTVAPHNQVAFIAVDANSDQHLVTVNLDDGKPPVDLDRRETLLGPAFSPDGKHIAFLADDAAGKMQVWETAADGLGTHELTADTGFHPFAGYTPDGQSLLFVSDQDTSSEVYRVPLDPTRR